MKTIKTIVMALASLILMSVIASGATASVDCTNRTEPVEKYDIMDISLKPDRVINGGYISENPEPTTIELDIGEIAETRSPLELLDLDISTKRLRFIEINPVLYTTDISEGTNVVLNLFEDATFTSSIQGITEYINGGIGMHGDIEGFFFGYLIFTIVEEAFVGSIVIPENNQTFSIRYDTDIGMHYLFEVDIDNLDNLTHGEPLIPKEYSENDSNELFSGLSGGPSTPQIPGKML